MRVGTEERLRTHRVTLRRHCRGEFLGPAQEIGARIRPDRVAARAEVFAFVETFYNRRRLRRHKTLGCLTPAETRQRHPHALAV
ncbi:hypothetical protein LUW75_07150 [Streptomyces sp. MRC013]|uniref:hypothetical protein n=1 Tax=Streptomyces sp. MRC013 TaxID=2898276 RepID=UPI0020271131|nr:hypothetical protein [Streptomyces sp. MRC013]URM89806.1 hypothetical protein LUW75_07150 [Streptomyces sp. MRC013]